MSPLLFLSPPAPSIILWTLLAILFASATMFYLLVHRATAQSRWLALYDWADANDFDIHGEGSAPFPEPLAALIQPKPRILISLNDPDTTLVQIETQREGQTARWNLLLRRIEFAWPTTAARPRAHTHSIIDLLPLSIMHANPLGERFILYGTEQLSLRSLARSSVSSGLLPADIGLLLLGHYLILDFSTRPFDVLSLQRLDSLAEQLVPHLPLH